MDFQWLVLDTDPPPPSSLLALTFHWLYCGSHAKLGSLASAAGAHRCCVWLHLSCHCVTSIVYVLTGCKSSSVTKSCDWSDRIMHEAWVKRYRRCVECKFIFILCTAKLKYRQPLLLFKLSPCEDREMFFGVWPVLWAFLKNDSRVCEYAPYASVLYFCRHFIIFIFIFNVSAHRTWMYLQFALTPSKVHHFFDKI